MGRLAECTYQALYSLALYIPMKACGKVVGVCVIKGLCRDQIDTDWEGGNAIYYFLAFEKQMLQITILLEECIEHFINCI